MVTSESTTSNFTSKFPALKQSRFTGQLILKGSLEQEWIFYLYLGRILYATGGNHLVRRWQRTLNSYAPQIDLNNLEISSDIYKSSAETFNGCWEYQLLHTWLEQHKVTREQVAVIIQSNVTEVLFDVIQAMRTTYQVEQVKPFSTQLVFLDPEQAVVQVQQTWQIWQAAKIADIFPNQAPVIKQLEQLQQQTSASVYNALTTLLNGENTLRDIAIKTKRGVLEITSSLLAYIQAGIVELKEIPDLPVPISPPPQAKPSSASSQGALVACVDDSPLVCQTMEKILSTEGYQFLAVQDSLRAIATLLTRKPDLIFLDLVMPHTNGYEICSQLRKVSTFRETPIIILTGNDGIIDRVRAKMVGATDFLSKPVNAETVLAVASQHLKNSSLVD